MKRKTAHINTHGRSSAVGEFYHVYNRGVDKRVIFNDVEDIGRFLQSMQEFNGIEPIGSLYEHSFYKKKEQLSQLGRRTSKLNERLVHIIAYCLNPNHYHFILEQCVEGGISEFMKRLGGGYAKYFNNKYKRSGTLFQGKYKIVHIDSNEYLLYVSVYVNLNNKVHQLGRPTSTASKLVNSASSFNEYIQGDKNKGGEGRKGGKNGSGKNRKLSGEKIIQNESVILEQFKNRTAYKAYAKETLSNIQGNKELYKELKQILIE